VTHVRHFFTPGIDPNEATYQLITLDGSLPDVTFVVATPACFGAIADREHVQRMKDYFVAVSFTVRLRFVDAMAEIKEIVGQVLVADYA
jgi:hypothetical protein